MKYTKLDERLSAVASLVDAGEATADIGSDHAYIPIYLMQRGISESVLVTDINEGPLRNARENFARAGITDGVRFSLFDGIAKDVPRAYGTVIVAGMGGHAVVDMVLRVKEELIKNCTKLIVQPMRDVALVRKALTGYGGRIVCERRAKTDNGKIYTVVKFVFGGCGTPLTEPECVLGRYTDCVDKDLYAEDADRNVNILKKIVSEGGVEKAPLLAEIEKYLTEIERWQA